MPLYHAARGSRTLGAAALALAVPHAAAAAPQDPSSWRETVTVTAEASPLTFDAQSRVLYVITREQIARLPVRSVGDALALLAPVDVRTRGVDGMQADYSVRGASFGQALVLLDGVRLNDAQSGHHNSDIPVVLDDIERIEVLAGAGSSLHGADAFGGTINIVTRRDRRRARVAAGAGSSGTVDLGGGADWSRLAVAGSLARSDGFMFDRDYRTSTLTARMAAGTHRVTVAWLDRAFGANGFYGASPSKEWTSQLLATVERSRLPAGAWRASWRASGRAHRDRFLWDVRRPGVLENRHQSHALSATGQIERDLDRRTRLAVGAEAGSDWVRSSNLGDHAYLRGAAFLELRHRRDSSFVTPAVRVDGYSRFGPSISPSLSAGRWLGPVKLRGNAGHAFRVPTFTELYYRDPNHLASGDLAPERAWSFEAGADWLAGPHWLLGATGFARVERDVIDWVRPTAGERWQTANIRRVTTRGVELSARRALGAQAQAEMQYTFLDSRVPSLDLLSKYVLDLARHRLAASVTTGIGPLSLGARLGHTRRLDGREYTLVDARVSRQFGAFRLGADVRNLLGEAYQEVAGVDMPGRNARVDLAWTLR